jgi:hypothetical protein
MLMLAAWRLIRQDPWTTLTTPNGASYPSLLLFVFPLCSALVVGSLYWGSRGARAEDAKIQPWRKWGKSLAINYCGGLLLLEGLLFLRSLGLDISVDLSAIGRTLGVLLAIMCLLAINQMPKLPWFERRFSPGGNLGPIYGPRYMRTQSTILVAFMISVIAFDVTAPPPVTWRSAPYIPLGTAFLVVWSIAWRCHLGRRWRLEQSQRAG